MAQDLMVRLCEMVEELPKDEQANSVYALSRVLGCVLAANSNDQEHLSLGIKAMHLLLRRDALDAWALLAAED